MREYLTTQIRLRETRLADLDREKVEVAAEMRAYQDVLTRLADEAPVGEPAAVRMPSRRKPVLSNSAGKLGDVSVVVLRRSAELYPEPITYDVALEAARAVPGREQFKRENIRSTFWALQRNAWVERIGEGEHRITPDGADKIGVELADLASSPHEANEPPGAEATDGSDVRPEGAHNTSDLWPHSQHH